MKAIQFTEYGGPEVLEVFEVDEPHADTGQVRIAVHAAGVNPWDAKVRSGAMQQMAPVSFPAGTGLEASGIVDEVGADVTGVAVGDAVFGAGPSTFAEYAVLQFWVKKPDALSFEEAAGFPVAVETAIRILDQVGVQPGQTLVVSGAAGGVGSAVVQLAVSRGVTVIGTASAGNQDHLVSLGALATTYGDGWVERVRALAPQGVDAALDLAGAGVIAELIELTGEPAKVLSIADFSAPSLGAQVSASSANQVAAYTEAVRLFEAGAFSLPVTQTFPLEKAGDAQAASATGHTRGKIVVTVTEA
ncbi:NADP-dependent oxidoreductase [Acidothermaceae bacterium B102]|nr:NADP-dependent oxidoreductase [Acidothermaceae bacterium B102]